LSLQFKFYSWAYIPFIVDSISNQKCFFKWRLTEEGYLTLNQGDYIKISFEDQGCGISEENLEKIFVPYFSTKDIGINKGQGLGLLISYSIIEKHGGLIIVESELDAGSIVAVYLPAFSIKAPEFQKIIEDEKI